ncbi:hypothetical protein [Lederbergia lenta]|uniref:O-antigen polymerase n=1 Tax=Lederbergia lenta TaxID=1467 RepID=A0A2X4W3C6_LEDLE|nr:hypothetical protein [Lederbergia lenta]MEC2324682.1 hypothetical protein [Lederbergia lenta]SQI58666.1 O-antigen polymerase [Lederbergia lenta]
MKNEDFREIKKERHHHGGRHKTKDVSAMRGAKTFRRGRAIAFLEIMNLKRATIKQQLDEPEFQSIKQILVGELKALDMVINEFVQLFEIQEHETKEQPNKIIEKMKKSVLDDKDSIDNSEKGMDLNETN